MRPPSMIVSGGQTGADRAALDFALSKGIAYGGWCPVEGWAEDLPHPPGVLALYPLLTPTTSADVSTRTGLNVRDSDATLIIAAAPEQPTDSRGTELTVTEARRLQRPYLVVPAGGDLDPEAVSVLDRALPTRYVLNVAGPRESEAPGTYEATVACLTRLFGSERP